VTLTVSHKLPTKDSNTHLLFDLLYSTDADETTFNWQMQSAKQSGCFRGPANSSTISQAASKILQPKLTDEQPSLSFKLTKRGLSWTTL